MFQYRPKHARTLVFVGDVVLSFGVHKQRGQQERLVQLILQVDVVEACKDGTRGQIQLQIPQKAGGFRWYLVVSTDRV